MRFVKQLIYGVFYLAIFGGLGFGLYKLNLFAAPTCMDGRLNQQEEEVDCGGPNCQSCELAHLQPISASVQYFSIANNTNAILIFSNPNLNYGATFSYTADFYDVNRQKLYSMTKESYIYSAEAQRVIVEPNLPFNSGAIFGAPEVTLSNISWKAKGEFQSPVIQLRQLSTTVSGSVATVSGLVANRESSSVAEVAVGVMLAKKSDKSPVGSSKTILQALRPFEERAFKVLIPLTATLKIADIDTQIFTAAKR